MHVRTSSIKRHASGIGWAVCALLGVLIALVLSPKRPARSSDELRRVRGHSGAVVSGGDRGDLGIGRLAYIDPPGRYSGYGRQGRGDAGAGTTVAPKEVGFLLAGPIVKEMVPYLAEYLATASDPLIYIDSPGGDMEASVEMAAGISAHGGVRCIVRATASSGAFGILQACKERLLSSKARLMTHQPRVGVLIPLDLNMANYVASEVLKSTLTWNALCSSRLKISKVEYAAKVNGKDWVMGATEAVAIGAADSILP